MNILTHIKNLKIDDFNSATYGSLILGVADIIWLTKDILHNGSSNIYSLIALLFLIGNTVLMIGLYQHSKHLRALKSRKNTNKQRIQELEERLERMENKGN